MKEIKNILFLFSSYEEAEALLIGGQEVAGYGPATAILDRGGEISTGDLTPVDEERGVYKYGSYTLPRLKFKDASGREFTSLSEAEEEGDGDLEAIML